MRIAALPVGFAFAGGSGDRGGAPGAGVGAAGMGSAGVGGGAPAGRVGGGPPAGLVGWVAEFEQPERQWVGWNGQPQFECRRGRCGRPDAVPRSAWLVVPCQSP
jgi:hypothetical protein